MNWLTQLQTMTFSDNDHSQLGESSIIEFIFQHIQPTNKQFVDIGAGFYGKGIMSNTNKLIEQGWQGIQVDANNDNDPKIKKLFVTPDNILRALWKWDALRGMDLLTIDIDSFDLDILEKIVPEYKPRVICSEFNGTLDPALSVKLKYEPGYVWDKTNKYGYSFGAGVNFAAKYGYKTILNQLNQNLFMVRSELVGDVPEIKAEQVFYHAVNSKAVWEEYQTCEHKNTIGSYFGGNKYIVKCKDCGVEI